MRYLCIHGHFYQPPRENPWLEAIELQDSAYPYHDWNERVTAECYAPNAAARILDNEQQIVRIVNNYSRISFNFGPTLLSWAQEKAPELFCDVLEGERESRRLFNGHGNAIAQCYNHMIMPLANTRDKRTQVLWGLADFQHRFGRDSEGMWLPETAVDLETLDILAERGVGFTILAPSQAARFRPLSGGEWTDVSGGRIDPTRPYLCRLASGRSIVLFFYDGPISRAVAFEGLLHSGDKFLSRLQSAYNDSRSWDQLAHIATDGESYGHHHRYGEMALAWALDQVQADHGRTRLTNYGQYLETHPPAHEVEIFNQTAWSCAHGVGRWSVNCGCNTGAHPGWHQEWRAPLRAALDWLRDEVAPKYESAMRVWSRDPWRTRDEYIRVMLDRSPESRAVFLEEQLRPLKPRDEVMVWRLLELQRQAMLMYTSCGWFFDELSNIETVQVIRYAGRVVQLAEQLFGDSIEMHFLERLRGARSNISELRDGARIYESAVKPTMVDLKKVGAHFAISSLFQDYPEESRIYCYSVSRQEYSAYEAGRMKIAFGRAQFTSEITRHTAQLTFAALHFGDHNMSAGIREFVSPEQFEQLVKEAWQNFSRADIPEVIRLFDKGFGGQTYSLKSLFRDEQRRIFERIMTTTLDESEAVYRQLYEHHAPLMRFMQDLGTPLPKALSIAAEYALNSRLRLNFAQVPPDAGRIRAALEEARSGNVELDATTLEFTLRRSIERMAASLLDTPLDLELLIALEQTVSMACSLPFPMTLWTVQNLCYELMQDRYARQAGKAHSGDETAKEWVEVFRTLAGHLRLRMEALAPAPAI
jgi:alpha-amylase/alpha-mannosidase (GH57 family)